MLRLVQHPNSYTTCIYYIDTDEIPGFFLLLKNHVFITYSEDTIFIFHVRILVSPWLLTLILTLGTENISIIIFISPL